MVPSCGCNDHTKACAFSQTETEELVLPFTDYRILFLRIKLLYNDVNDTGPG